MIKISKKLRSIGFLITLTSLQAVNAQVAGQQLPKIQNPFSIHVLNESQNQIITTDHTEKKEIIVAIPILEKSILSLTIGRPMQQLEPNESTKVIFQQRSGIFNAKFGRIGRDYGYGEFQSEKINFYGYYVRDLLNNINIDHNQYYKLVKIDLQKLTITPIINQNIMFSLPSRFNLNDSNESGISIKPSSIGAEVTLKNTNNLKIGIIGSAGPHFGIQKDQPVEITPGFNLKFNILFGRQSEK